MIINKVVILLRCIVQGGDIVSQDDFEMPSHELYPEQGVGLSSLNVFVNGLQAHSRLSIWLKTQT